MNRRSTIPQEPSHHRQLKQPILAEAQTGIGCFSCRALTSDTIRSGTGNPFRHHSMSGSATRKRFARPLQNRYTRGAAAHAFTLLEVILAVTIAGALLAGAATLMVSVTNAWLERQDRHFFEDHVDGVTEFIQASFSMAGTEVALGAQNGGDEAISDPNTSGEPIAETDGSQITIDISNTPGAPGGTSSGSTEATSGSGLVRVLEDPIDWAKPPGFADYQDPLLHFGLKETPPLLIQTENAPIVGVQAFLNFKEDEGLSLLWYSPLQEDSEDINDLRRTPISDLITKVEYIYWDERFEKWETETEPKEGEGEEQFILPRFLKLTFEYEGVTKERTLTIPVPSRSALIF